MVFGESINGENFNHNFELLLHIQTVGSPATLMPRVLTMVVSPPAYATQAIREMQQQLAMVSTIHTCWTLKFKPMCRY